VPFYCFMNDECCGAVPVFFHRYFKSKLVPKFAFFSGLLEHQVNIVNSRSAPHAVQNVSIVRLLGHVRHNAGGWRNFPESV
jgi:hypothetical protein